MHGQKEADGNEGNSKSIKLFVRGRYKTVLLRNAAYSCPSSLGIVDMSPADTSDTNKHHHAPNPMESQDLFVSAGSRMK